MQQAIFRRAALVAVLAASCVASAAGFGKNDAVAVAPPAPIVDGAVAAGILPASFVNCSEHVRNVETTASSFVPIASCTLNLPVDGTVLVLASGYADKLVNPTDGYEALFGLTVDGDTAGLSTAYRWLDVVSGGQPNAGAFATNTLAPLTAGRHTIALSGYRTHGTVPVRIEYATVFALLIPNDSGARTCGFSGSNATASGSTALLLGECLVTVPEDSIALVFGSAAGAIAGNTSANDYEANYSVSVDTMGNDPSVDRWINLYSDASTTDGADDSLSAMSGKAVSAGPHTFRFYMTRTAGSGTAGVYRRTLSVVTIPAALHAVCASTANSSITLNTLAPSTLRSCALNFSQRGSLLTLGNASLLADGANEITLYNETGAGNLNPDSQRHVQTRSDSGDGSDRAALALSVEARTPGPVTVGTSAMISAGTTESSAFDGAVIGLAMPPAQLALFADGFE